MKIGIFCSANSKIDPDFFKTTEEFGCWIAKNNHSIVFGGCNLGLMECIAKAVHEHGGTTIGVIPSVIEKNGRISPSVDVRIMCDNLSDRKDLMLVHSDVVVALPGGIGTLDEIFTVAASRTIGYHQKDVILLNIKSFWQPLISLLDQLQSQGLVRGHWSEYIKVANTLDELTDLLNQYA